MSRLRLQVSLAERVAWERCDRTGGQVGFSIRLENKRSDDTQLLFCTTGILLRRLVADPTLEGLTHIVIDEVHERDRDSDFLLIILREMLPQRPNLRVVLMSATIQCEKFSDYFNGAPIVELEGRTFPVSCHPLEHILQYLDYCAPIAVDARSTRDGRQLHGAVDFGDGHKAKRIGNGGNMSRAARERQMMKSLPPMPVVGADGSVNFTGKLAGNASVLALERELLALGGGEAGEAAGRASSAAPRAAGGGDGALKCAMCGQMFAPSLFGMHVATCFGPADGAEVEDLAVEGDDDGGLADLILGGAGDAAPRGTGAAPAGREGEVSALERELAMMAAGGADAGAGDERDTFYGDAGDDFSNPMCVRRSLLARLRPDCRLPVPLP
jgi:hypothetical protein